MTVVALERNINNYRFLIINTILAKPDEFSIEDIMNETKKQIPNAKHIIENCLDDLLDNGLIYEIGSRYVVRNREERWRRM